MATPAIPSAGEVVRLLGMFLALGAQFASIK